MKKNEKRRSYILSMVFKKEYIILLLSYLP